MKNRNVYIYSSVVCGLLLMLSCTQRSKTPGDLPHFTLSSEKVAGEQRQVIAVTNGLSLYFSESNLVIWFNNNGVLNVDFDPKTLKPASVMLERSASGDDPAQTVWDMNGDGVPEMRSIVGQPAKEVFYRGDWYPKQKKGTNLVISVGGNDVSIRYDGKGWVDTVTNSK